MSTTADHTWPDLADAQFARDLVPLEIARGWATAYREGPRDARFPSDPDAEFFPRDMDLIVAKIEIDAKVIAALREALVPFAKMADQVDEWRKGTGHFEGAFDANDLRRAREILATFEQTAGESK